MNNVVLVGRLTREPELRYIAGSGTAVATFSIAVDRDYVGKDGKRETDFIDIQTWGKSAESCANYLAKGSMVAVNGSIRIDRYQAQDGSNRTSFRINADRVQFLQTKAKSEAKPNSQEPLFEPAFEPTGLDANEFSAIDDSDLPF